MYQNSSWKYFALIFIVLAGLLYALPNVFGEDLAVQVSSAHGDPLGENVAARARSALDAEGLKVEAVGVDEGRLMVRLPDETTQLKAADVLKRTLGRDYLVAFNLASRTPAWLAALGAKPMALGLDLRGGVHFLLEIDLESAVRSARERYAQDIRQALRKERLRYLGSGDDTAPGDSFRFRNIETRDAARKLIEKEFPELTLVDLNDSENPGVQTQLDEQELKRIEDFSMTQSLTTLRNRVNELGVAEPVVQRQGRDRIVVQLPGVQDTTRAKEILGATATLEYRLVAQDQDATLAERTGMVPAGTQLFKAREGYPILLKRDVITTGDHITDASSGLDQESGSPAVFVTLDGQGAKAMLETTTANVNKRMAVLFVETRTDSRYVDGKEVREKIKVEEVINDAVIRGVFGRRFQTTGLQPREAQNLALLLRAGALPAPIDIVEERTVGPSLGADNIRRGLIASAVGLAAMLIFVAFYYRVFGLIANSALLLNLLLTVAAMSQLQATLTLPGIAGIVLSLAMAVDANVLICERIREELDAGSSPLAAIAAGYNRAFVTILDSNLTTMIAAVAMFGLGSGPIKGFAVTLLLGIVISMFTAITVTRIIAHIVYGRGQRRVEALSI